MIKILNIITDSNIGGAGKCVISFAKHFSNKEFELFVAVPKGSLLIDELINTSAKYIEIDNISDSSFNIKGILSQIRLIKKVNPQIVHTHASLSGRIAAKICFKKVVYTRHCVFEPSPFMKSFFGKLINKITSALFSDKIIAVAEAAKENLTDVGISEKRISVVLNGIEEIPKPSEEEIIKAREKFLLEEGQKAVSIAARLENVKGHKYFIEAAKIVKEKGFAAKFIIAGTGSLESELKEYAKKLDANVYFAGFLSNVKELYYATYISANASFGTEATSLALLEGMSLGIPAVVSDFGGNPGVIKNGENGFVVNKCSSEALAEGIIKLLENDGLYEKMQRKSKDIFKSIFTAKAMTLEIERIYKSLLK